ncbi:hypothetical protein [Pseudomonas sp. R5(2019)]|uniref:hypothetical protein n=1 Tax=Pseudomonas sp. R5(2019) TaxID=2697566 RepID=UPI001411C435|nr:hypothetical protein [Pseudomonas sp. R5(2019)]NBA95545.1 hypothetical protein [Pseudomonas sp. R5(2019)]
MTRLTFSLLLLATSTANAALPQEVTVWHDDERNVTCWLFWGFKRGGISCIPDSHLQAGNERQLSPHEQDTPTPAMAPVRWNEERYSL